MSEADQVLTIDVVSDVVCPWCYLGEKRLEEALSDEAGPVVVRWRPYQLDPTIPEGGLGRRSGRSRRSIVQGLFRRGTRNRRPRRVDRDRGRMRPRRR